MHRPTGSQELVGPSGRPSICACARPLVCLRLPALRPCKLRAAQTCSPGVPPAAVSRRSQGLCPAPCRPQTTQSCLLSVNWACFCPGRLLGGRPGRRLREVPAGTQLARLLGRWRRRGPYYLGACVPKLPAPGCRMQVASECCSLQGLRRLGQCPQPPSWQGDPGGGLRGSRHTWMSGHC